MSANEHYEDSDREFSRPPKRTAPAGLGFPPLREENQIIVNLSYKAMPTMALRSTPLPSMMQHMAFDDQRQYSSSRPRTQVEPVELPSIRQVCKCCGWSCQSCSNKVERPFQRSIQQLEGSHITAPIPQGSLLPSVPESQCLIITAYLSL